MLRDPFFWILVGVCTAVVGLWWAFAHPQPLRLRSRGGLGTLGPEGGHIDDYRS